MPDDLRSRILAVLDEIERIDAETAQRKKAILEKAGIAPDAWERLTGQDSLLTARHGYATVSPMPSTANVAEKHTGPVAKGKVGDLLVELEIPTLLALSKELGEEYDTVRSWSSRGGWPARVNPRIEKLRAQRAKKNRKG